jgi:hypothetical protein
MMRQSSCEKFLNKKYECSNCNKRFSSKNSLKIHIKTICKDITNNYILNDELEQVKNKLKEFEKIKEELEESKQKIENLENEIKKKPGRPKKITNNTNCNNTNTTNIANQTINKYMIVSFGKEDLEKLTLNDKREILNSSYGAILKCAIKMNFNPEIPEQNNIFITNPKSDYAYKYEDGKFIAIKTNDLIDDLIYHRINDVRELVDQNNILKISNKKIEKVNNLLNNIDDEKPNDINNLKKDLKLTLFNENDLAIENKKKIIKP